MRNSKKRARELSSAPTGNYRKANPASDAGSEQKTGSNKFQDGPDRASRRTQSHETGAGQVFGVRHGGDARGGTESAAVKRRHEPRPAGGRRPEEGGSPRGMRGSKRRAAELGAGLDHPLRADAAPGVVYQHGGGTDRAIDRGGARRGPGGRLRRVATTPTTSTTTDGVDRNARKQSTTRKGQSMARTARPNRTTKRDVGESSRGAGQATRSSGGRR